MSVITSNTVAHPAGAKMTPRFRREPARLLSERKTTGKTTNSNPYSPILCIALLLAVGVIVKIGPSIHAYLSLH